MFKLFTSEARRNDKAPQFVPGDVLNGEYEVKSVEVDWRGELLYKCRALSGEEEVLVRRADWLKQPDNSRVTLPHQKAPTSTGAPSKDGLHFVKRFAVQFGDDVFVFVVQRLNGELEDDDGDLENPRTCDEPQQRPGPANASLVIWRWGDCEMEVDFLANGSYLQHIFMDLFALAWWGLLLFFTVWPVLTALEAEDAGQLWFYWLWCLSLIPLYLAGLMLLHLAIESRCHDDSLTITPTNFNLRRRIGFKPRHHASGTNKYWRLGKLSWTTISGKTSDLTRAVIKEYSSDECGTYNYFALMEGRKEHKLWHSLSDDEKEWLVSEINEVLENIKQRTAKPLESAKLCSDESSKSTEANSVESYRIPAERSDYEVSRSSPAESSFASEDSTI